MMMEWHICDDKCKMHKRTYFYRLDQILPLFDKCKISIKWKHNTEFTTEYPKMKFSAIKKELNFNYKSYPFQLSAYD